MRSIYKATTYQKNLLNDLRHAWLSLYQAVIVLEETALKNLLLIYLQESLRWDSPEQLLLMKKTYELVKQCIREEEVPDKVLHCLEKIRLLLQEYKVTLKLSGEDVLV